MLSASSVAALCCDGMTYRFAALRSHSQYEGEGTQGAPHLRCVDDASSSHTVHRVSYARPETEQCIRTRGSD